MGQRIQSWRMDGGQTAWLSTLIDTMEHVARPEQRANPCDGGLLATLRAQLALPAQGSVQGSLASRFSLRN